MEISDDPGGEYTGKLLAGAGADVIKVEPPSGAAGRRIGPFIGDRTDPEASLHFHWYNAGKRSVTIDEADEAGRRSLAELIAGADVLLTSLPPSRPPSATWSRPTWSPGTHG